MLKVDDPICIRLRSDPAPFEYNSDTTGGPAALVLSMSHRGVLHAVVMLDAKGSGESYRPDEKLVLAFAAHQQDWTCTPFRSMRSPLKTTGKKYSWRRCAN